MGDTTTTATKLVVAVVVSVVERFMAWIPRPFLPKDAARIE
jgi:hypothetical protein